MDFGLGVGEIFLPVGALFEEEKQKSPARIFGRGTLIRADDGTRTRDPNLGKVMRYQLRYIRKYVRP